MIAALASLVGPSNVPIFFYFKNTVTRYEYKILVSRNDKSCAAFGLGSPGEFADKAATTYSDTPMSSGSLPAAGQFE